MYIVCGQQTMTATTPTLLIDLGSQVPVYRQITSGLRTLLVSGDLAAGSRLPTTRELAMDLGVHHNTVADAYRILAHEGWLDVRRRRGATVLPRTRPNAGPEVHDRWVHRLGALVAEGLAEGLSVDGLAGALEAERAAIRRGGADRGAVARPQPPRRAADETRPGKVG